MFFKPIMDKVKLRLSAWKGTLISFVGRFQFVKAITNVMIMRCIPVYCWVVYMIKYLEICIKIFIWSGKIEKPYMVSVAWKKCTTPCLRAA